ncbi:membrane protein [Chania multitudinisentens RB-25]|uniref:Outer-membrane lipoprotein LolB n=1 Tax=Chania multitudinisentens RB-25 TaxID=1441930 RepID=W0L3U6_9GAMM|nr:lipoprotein insertase outer membrane protein LolB [Chania multitudinisentens]AHG18413.1 membrane protein [Chania multitudinisentens RB-25]
MPIRNVNLLRLIPLASLVLVGCTLTQPSGPATSPTSPQWRAHEQAVQQLEQYQTRGAFAYLSDQKKVYARFFWQQYAPERYRLLLTNPLGSTELELNVQKEVVQLTDNQGKRYNSDNPEDMIRKLTGMDIPLNNLRQWILGLPGEATDFTLDQQYRLSKLTYQQGDLTWVVTYQDYNTDLQPPLPSRLELQQGDQRIKLKMDNWTLK